MWTDKELFSFWKVHKAGLESEEAETEEREQQSYLVQVTLVSGHGLAVRDRTGTFIPHSVKHLGMAQTPLFMLEYCGLCFSLSWCTMVS